MNWVRACLNWMDLTESMVSAIKPIVLSLHRSGMVDKDFLLLQPIVEEAIAFLASTLYRVSFVWRSCVWLAICGFWMQKPHRIQFQTYNVRGSPNGCATRVLPWLNRNVNTWRKEMENRAVPLMRRRRKTAENGTGMAVVLSLLVRWNEEQVRALGSVVSFFMRRRGRIATFGCISRCIFHWL